MLQSSREDYLFSALVFNKTFIKHGINIGFRVKLQEYIHCAQIEYRMSILCESVIYTNISRKAVQSREVISCIKHLIDIL